MRLMITRIFLLISHWGQWSAEPCLQISIPSCLRGGGLLTSLRRIVKDGRSVSKTCEIWSTDLLLPWMVSLAASMLIENSFKQRTCGWGLQRYRMSCTIGLIECEIHEEWEHNVLFYTQCTSVSFCHFVSYIFFFTSSMKVILFISDISGIIVLSTHFSQSTYTSYPYH